MSGRPQMLVLRALGLGDLLTGVPALRALRSARPAQELVLAAPAALAPLARLTGVVDRVLPASGLEPLRTTTPDTAVNLHGRGPQSHRLLAALAPRQLVAFGCREAAHEGPQWRADEHEVRRWCRLVEETLHVPADPDDLALERPDGAPVVTGAVVVHPGAAYPSRRWPADRFAEVAAWAARQGHPVVVTGTDGERSLAERVCRDAGLPGGSMLAGRTRVLELASLVAAARLVVSGDTGVAHLASAYGTPSVVLFGPTPPSLWGPPAHGPHTVIWRGTAVDDPWADEVHPALLETSVEEVIAAAERAPLSSAGR